MCCKLDIVANIIDTYGPILAADGNHLVTMNGKEFLLWKVDGDTFTVEASLPADIGSRFKVDVICLAKNAEHQLRKYIKCHCCNNQSDCQ